VVVVVVVVVPVMTAVVVPLWSLSGALNVTMLFRNGRRVCQALRW